MTTVISRLFPDAETAQDAVGRLIGKGVPKRQCSVFGAGTDASVLEAAMVHPDATSAYTSAMQAGQTLVVVRTTYKPLGAARLTREMLADHGGVETGGITEDHFVAGTGARTRNNSILEDHPLLLTSPYEMAVRGPITGAAGVNMLRPHKAKRSAMSGGRFMSRAFWPMKLVSQKHRSSSVMHGGRYMSKMFWPRPLLKNKPRRKSVMPGGGMAFGKFFGVPTIR